MMYGNNRSLEREKIYNLLKENGEVVQCTGKIQWITIYENTLKKLILGITNKGEYIFIDAGKIFLLNDKKMFLYCVKLLETPYSSIQEYIELQYKNVFSQADVGETEVFPYYEIVEFALENLYSDYWVELVWKWYEHLSCSQKYGLYDSLEKISKMKKFSQQNRNIARKEMKRLKQYSE